jgi:hypothetical protein
MIPANYLPENFGFFRCEPLFIKLLLRTFAL